VTRRVDARSRQVLCKSDGAVRRNSRPAAVAGRSPPADGTLPHLSLSLSLSLSVVVDMSHRSVMVRQG
jgi:hypothetical protein